MRISELLGARVVDDDGAELGRVHDVRLTVSERDGRVATLRVAGLVVGGDGPLSRAAHAWGYAEGRAQAPLVLRRLTAGAVRRSRFVPARRVEAWELPVIRISGSGDDLEPTLERIAGE